MLACFIVTCYGSLLIYCIYHFFKLSPVIILVNNSIHEFYCSGFYSNDFYGNTREYYEYDWTRLNCSKYLIQQNRNHRWKTLLSSLKRWRVWALSVMNVITHLTIESGTSASCWLIKEMCSDTPVKTKWHEELVTSFCFDANKYFYSYSVSAELSQITSGSSLLLNSPADRGDCTAASDYKHPRWLCPFPPVFSSVGIGMWGVCPD